MTTVYLVRHGAVDNPQGIEYGRLPGFPLSDRGRRQMTALGNDMKDAGIVPSTIISSPLLRAQESAKIISDVLGIRSNIRTDDQLMEWDQGQWTGHPTDEFAAVSGYYATPMRVVGMESLETMSERVRTAIAEAVASDPTGPIVIVSHREPIASALLSYLGKGFSAIHDIDLLVGSAWEVIFDDADPRCRKAFDRNAER